MFLSHLERMFGDMGYATWTTDELEQELLENEAERSRLTAKDMAILEELDYRQVATVDGCRSLSEWATARLDIHPDTAKSLVRTMRRTVDRPDLREALATGDISFDRMEALSRIPRAGRAPRASGCGHGLSPSSQKSPDQHRDRISDHSPPVPGHATFPGRIMVETVGRIRRSHRSPGQQDTLGKGR